MRWRLWPQDRARGRSAIQGLPSPIPAPPLHVCVGPLSTLRKRATVTSEVVVCHQPRQPPAQQIGGRRRPRRRQGGVEHWLTRRSNSEGASTCSFCEAGQFPDHNNDGCVACEAGTSSAIDEETCTPCLPGFFPEQGAGACSYCAPGTHSDLPFQVMPPEDFTGCSTAVGGGRKSTRRGGGAVRDDSSDGGSVDGYNGGGNGRHTEHRLYMVEQSVGRIESKLDEVLRELRGAHERI